MAALWLRRTWPLGKMHTHTHSTHAHTQTYSSVLYISLQVGMHVDIFCIIHFNHFFASLNLHTCTYCRISSVYLCTYKYYSLRLLTVYNRVIYFYGLCCFYVHLQPFPPFFKKKKNEGHKSTPSAELLSHTSCCITVGTLWELSLNAIFWHKAATLMSLSQGSGNTCHKH